MQLIKILLSNIILPIMLVIIGFGITFKFDHPLPVIIGVTLAAIVNFIAVRKAKIARSHKVAKYIGSLDDGGQ